MITVFTAVRKKLTFGPQTQLIVSDGVAWSVCHDREPRKTAELTEMSSGMWTSGGPKEPCVTW